MGPPEIAHAAKDVAPGFALRAAGDVREWLKRSRADFDRSGRVIQTFVVSEAGFLLVADRRSEHVACAGGAPVLAAGEITFLRAGAGVEAEEVTNQSTGYCPEPASWKAVAEALARAGVPGPERYTTEFIFRRCEPCGQINLVKEGIFLCAVCERPLPPAWNFDVDEAQD